MRTHGYRDCLPGGTVRGEKGNKQEAGSRQRIGRIGGPGPVHGSPYVDA